MRRDAVETPHAQAVDMPRRPAPKECWLLRVYRSRRGLSYELVNLRTGETCSFKDMLALRRALWQVQKSLQENL